VAWVFFRAKTLPLALDYCQSLLGLQAPQPGSALAGGVMYDPYHLMFFVICALVAFRGVQTWEFTRALPPWKAALCLLLLVLSVLALWTQTANPFLYFQF